MQSGFARAGRARSGRQQGTGLEFVPPGAERDPQGTAVSRSFPGTPGRGRSPSAALPQAPVPSSLHPAERRNHNNPPRKPRLSPCLGSHPGCPLAISRVLERLPEQTPIARQHRWLSRSSSKIVFALPRERGMQKLPGTRVPGSTAGGARGLPARVRSGGDGPRAPRSPPPWAPRL